MRCVGLHLRGEGGAADEFAVETASGLYRVTLGGGTIRVAMGTPSFVAEEIPVDVPAAAWPLALRLEGRDFAGRPVGMGNPHCVIFCERGGAELAARFGPQVERDGRFPQRTNVEFVQVVDRDTLQVDVWERGTGLTLACGSGACAAAAAAIRSGRTGREVELRDRSSGCTRRGRRSGPRSRNGAGDLQREAAHRPAKRDEPSQVASG